MNAADRLRVMLLVGSITLIALAPFFALVNVGAGSLALCAGGILLMILAELNRP